MKQSRALIFSLCLAVFLTGFSALLYQVVWQRMLGLFSGSDVRSVTIVTSAFLAGLGVGSFTGSLLADRFSSRQAVQIYGFCNLGIGLFAFLSRFFYYDLLFLKFNTLARSPFVLLLVVFISLLIPTTLMGLSLPFLSKAVVRSVEKAANLITLLYGMNTLGAGLGTIVAGWYLIGTLGYERAVYLGGGLSLLVGLIALLVAARFTGEAGDSKPKVFISWQAVPRMVWVWCFLVFVSGFVVISLEIIWFRVLDVLLKSNAYTFAHILSFFLIGDAVGSLVGGRVLHRIHNPRRTFLWLQGFIALYSALIIWGVASLTHHYPLYNYIHEVGVRLDLTLNQNKLQWLVYIGLPALILLPPSFLVGFYYPIVQKAVQTDTALVGQRVGLVDMFNIAGNTLGGIVTGVIFLHWLGTATSLRIILGLGLLMMAVLWWESPRQRWSSGAICACLMGSLLFFPSNSELWRQLHSTRSDEFFVVAEDSSGVSAIREINGSALLYANGRHQGSIPYLEVHGFLGILPALIHPNPQQIMVIGIGSSGTPYAVGVNQQTERIVAVEIVGSELDVLKDYARVQPILLNFFDDPRYEIIVGDGRRELVFSDTQFDIIEADAILPISSHSGLLYSQEYFQSVREQLAEGGIMAQWNPTPRTEATFASVFPYGVVVEGYMLGSNQAIPYDVDRLLEQFEAPHTQAYLARGGFDLEALRAKITPPLREWSPQRPYEYSDGDINTDLFPKDEYYLNNG